MAFVLSDNAEAIRRRRHLLADSLTRDSVPPVWSATGEFFHPATVASFLHGLLRDYCCVVPTPDAVDPYSGDGLVLWNTLVDAGVIIITGNKEEATAVDVLALEPFARRHAEETEQRRKNNERSARLREAKKNGWRRGKRRHAISVLPRGWVPYRLADYLDRPLKWAGVYAVFCDGRLMYIGSSVNANERLILGHRIRCQPTGMTQTPWGEFADVVIKVRYARKCGEWLMREYRLINRLRPPGNAELKRRFKDGANQG